MDGTKVSDLHIKKHCLLIGNNWTELREKINFYSTRPLIFQGLFIIITGITLMNARLFNKERS